MFRKFITWLYERYVLVPMAREHGADEIQVQTYIEFEPDPAIDAQIEKNMKRPEIH